MEKLEIIGGGGKREDTRPYSTTDVVVTIDSFVRRLCSEGYAEATITIYSKGLALFKRYLAERGIGDLRQVTCEVAEDFKRSVMATTLAPESKALRLRPVKRLFEHLVRTNRLLINPCENLVETTRKHRRIGQVLSRRQIKRLMSMPDMTSQTGIRDRAVMEFLYSTGIRLGELLALRVDDVDLAGKAVFIRRGKGAKQRVLPVGTRAAHYLALYLEQVRPAYLVGRQDTDALFLTRTGVPVNAPVVRYFLRIYRVAAGIAAPVSPHVFRRSCATHFLQHGAGVRFVQELLGHASLRTTHSYTKVLPLELKRTHEASHPGVGDAGD